MLGPVWKYRILSVIATWKHIALVALVASILPSCLKNSKDSSTIDQDKNIQTSPRDLQNFIDSLGTSLSKNTEVYVYCACFNAPTIIDSTGILRPICMSGRITEDDLISDQRVIDTLIGVRKSEFARIIEESSKSIYTNPLPVKDHVNLLFALKDGTGNIVTVRYQDNNTLIYNDALRLYDESGYYLQIRDLLTKEGREIYDNGCRRE